MRAKGRILSLLLVFCLVAGLLPTAAFAAGTDTGKAIQIGASGISGYDSTDGYDYIYYGAWNGSPIKWRVLSDKTNTGGDGLFLLSDALLGTGTYGGVYFQQSYHYDSGTCHKGSAPSDGNHTNCQIMNAWQGSDAQSWCNSFYNTNLTTQEQGAVLVTTKSDEAFTSSTYSVPFAASEKILDNDKVFFLSAQEAENGNYGFTNDTARIANYGNSAGVWWLRSPYADYTYRAGAVDYYGAVYALNAYNDWPARPAFNLNLNSVLFTSAAEGGKISAAASGGNQGGGAADAIFEIDDYDGSEWKLTLLDTSRSFSVTETTATSASGGTVTLSYTGATVYNADTAPNEYISVIIADNSGAQYYGRITQPTDASGKIQITIPASLADGTYTLYVFSEQYNGGENDNTKLTDYASAFETVSLTVSNDTTAPALSNGTATRGSETDATVKFTSDEAGEYYYEVVDSGATVPDIDTTKAGTACDTTEQTISLDSLTGAGAKDIYIVVKDAAGNVSEKLQITIPAYIAPSYGISASPETLNFGSETVDYEAAPAAQTVTVTNTGNQNVTVTLPTSTNYTITAGTEFTGNTANLTPSGTATFTVQPNTGLAVGNHNETLSISGSNGTSASVELSFAVTEAAHIHEYGTDWKNDADKHWHECSCGAKADEADHVYDDGQDTTCNVCDYVRTVAPTTYTLTVDLKGGSGSTTGGEYTEGAVIHINAGTRSDYRFSGWTSSNGGSFADASSASTTFTMPAADTTVTANWQYNGGTGSTTDYYRLTFDTNGGSEIASIRRAEYTTIDLADYIPTREGYEFTGWYADEDLTDKVTSIRLTRNTTIYAGWEENKENPSTGGNPFTDVKESDWFYDDVMFVYKNGLMTGTSATTFSPYSNTTRAQIATIFYRLDGSPEVTGKNSFADVEYSPATTWYYDAVTWVQQSGVMGGYGNDLFGPNDPVTREQLASIFYRYAQYKGYDVSTTGSLDSFTDKDSVSAWAQEAMKWAVGNGIINGRENNLLDPQGTATRAEIAAMLHRFIEKYGPVIAGVTDKANPTSSQLNVPKTGDSTTEAVGWISLMAASAAGAAYATHKLRRRKKDGLKPPTPTPA